MKLSGVAVLAAAALFLLPLPALAADKPSLRLADAPGQEAPSDGGDNSAPDDSASDSSDNPFLPGEQLLGVSAGLQIPWFILPKTGEGAANLKLGGNFGFQYQYFLSPGFSVGGDLAASYNATIGGLSLFILPLCASASYWWTKLPFEFTVFGEAGVYMMRENHEGIIDPMAKAGVGAYWRLSSGWSVGLKPTFWLIPEIHYGNYKSLTQTGGFIETSLSAVYHL